MKKILLLFTCIFALAGLVNASNTGKITGTVTDSKTGEAVIGANVIVLGTHYGAATDLDGKYSIYNVPPGEYKLVISSVGYQKISISKVVVKNNLTTRQDIKMVTEDILSEEIVVEAEAPMIQKDLTSSSVTVTSSDIKAMPVENIFQVVNLQAGVVAGHFRGGRSNEVGYLIDGVAVNDVYNNSAGLVVENAAVRQLDVITGAFNAEYGRSMSGMVNIITQDGSRDKYELFVSSAVGNYYSSNTKIFRNLDKPFNIGYKDFSFTASGPVPEMNSLTFFFTTKYLNDVGYYFGKRVYNIADPTFDNSPENNDTGDRSWVPMDTERRLSLNPKLTWSTDLFKLSYNLIYEDSENRYYSHDWSYAPDGLPTHYQTKYGNTLKFSYFPSQTLLYELSLSANLYDYKGYLYKDPYDKRYVNPNEGSGKSYTFRFGGNDGGRYERYTNTYQAKLQMTYQVNDQHKVGAGIEAKLHNLYDHGWSIIATDASQYDSSGFKVTYPDLHVAGNQSYHEDPIEGAIYVQDKMEYDMMIINAGVRLDYFDPRSRIPVDLRNPQSSVRGGVEWKDSEISAQMSPRLGVSFPISDRGVIHFSYGHFFQPPSLANIYYNHEYLVAGGVALSSTTGNANMKPEQTVKYEFGLQQMLTDNLGLETSVYYQDIRNLTSQEIVKTYNQDVYARFINKDYGNVKGWVLSLDQSFEKFLSLKLDYTFQIAEGNSSDPQRVFQANQEQPPREVEKRITSLNWDQRHTLNLTTTVRDNDWGTASLIFNYGSGTPYTESEINTGGISFNNDGVKPSFYNFDFRYENGIDISFTRLSYSVLIYNIFNIENEVDVYSTTGRANNDYNVKFASPVTGYNTIEEYVLSPTRYSSPRAIKIGISFSL